MMFGLRSLISVVSLAVLTGCGDSHPNTSGPASPEKSSSQARNLTPVEITTQSGVKMVFVPGGEFRMGNERGDPDEGPAHQVRLGAFLMDKFEVTHEQFTRAQLPNPSHWQDDPQKPVERARWRDAKRYCNERSRIEGLKPCYAENTADWDCDYAGGYRLPTEAEWEYACRAGTEFEIQGDKLRPYAWTAENSDQRTHPVGRKKPNALGICDLLGNVSEWCEDVYSATYYTESPVQDPHGPPNPGKDVRRVIRGGSWQSSPEQCRPTARLGERTGNTDACFSTDYCGFRCVRGVSQEEVQRLRDTR